MGDNQRGNTIWNVKTNNVGFIDENVNIDNDDYDFASLGNKD